MKTITISLKEYETLKMHVNKAMDILNSIVPEAKTPPVPKPKRETKAQRMERIRAKFNKKYNQKST